MLLAKPRSSAGMLCVDEGNIVVGIEINANHLRGCATGRSPAPRAAALGDAAGVGIHTKTTTAGWCGVAVDAGGVARGNG